MLGARGVSASRSQDANPVVNRIGLAELHYRLWVSNCQLDVLLRVATHPQSRIDQLTPKRWAETFARVAVPAKSRDATPTTMNGPLSNRIRLPMISGSPG